MNISIITSPITSSPVPTVVMASIFAPLVLPTQQHDLPHNYSQRFKCFGEEGNVTAKQHLDKFNDFIDIEEVDHEDPKMKIFAHLFLERLKNALYGL